MSQRLLDMEMQSTASASSKKSGALGEGTSVASVSSSPRGDHESSVTIRGARRKSLSEATEQLFVSFKRSFDKDLQTSRPYIRASKNRVSLSATSSAKNTIGWSCLSGLSLSDISQISVFNLPISPCDLSNGQHYLSAEGISVASAYSGIVDTPGKILLLGMSIKVGDHQTPGTEL